jgi:excisionase family DNA binding protein
LEDQSKLVGELLVQVRELMRRLQEMSLPLVLTKKEAARQLGVKRTTLDSLIASGQLEVLRYDEDGHPRITSAEILRFVSEKARGARTTPAPRPSRAAKSQRTKVQGELAKLDAALKRRR